jgi:hypothetical protein
MATSSDPNYIYIARIAMPLFVPSAFVHGGERVRGANGDWIAVETEDVRAIVHRVLKIGYRERDELENIISAGLNTRNGLQIEQAGYALILRNDPRSALRILRHETIPWTT